MNGNAQELKQIAVEMIADSTTNPRKSFAGMEDLRASIAEGGIRVPLLVRPNKDDSQPQFELVCGARRLRAAGGLGLKTVPCIVRVLTDEEARETQIIENLQRADVHPVEEAEAFRELRDRLGSIPLLAARVGKSESYVAKSLRLLALTLHSRDALRGGLITIAHALLLARLGEGEQNAALKWTLDRNAGSKTSVDKVVEDRLGVMKRDQEGKSGNRFYAYIWEPETVQKLKSHIEGGSGTKLSRAPWSLTDDGGLLAGVPNCAECDKNTKANAPLFGDLDIGDPTCTDGACFQAKTAAFVQIELRSAGHDEKAKPKKLVPRLSWRPSSVKPSVCENDIRVIVETAGRCGETANPAKILKQGQWVEAKKGSCLNVRAGVTADWSDAGQRGFGVSEHKLHKPGQTLQVCIAVGCKVHRKDWEKPKSSNGNGGGHSQADYDRQTKEREAKQAAYVAAEVPVRKAVYAAIKQKAAGKLSAEDLLRDLIGDRRNECAAACELAGISFKPAEREWEADRNAAKPLSEALTKRAGTELLSLVFDILHVEDVVVAGHMYANRKQDREDLWKLAERYKVDADAIAKKMEPQAAKPPVKTSTKKAAGKKPAAKKSPRKSGKKGK